MPLILTKEKAHLSSYNYLRILICPTLHGYNHKLSRELGYYWRSHLYRGINSNMPKNILTWNGNTSLTWENITQSLFKKNLDFGNDFDYYQTSSDMVAKKIRIMPYYECWEISNFTQVFWIGTYSAVSVYLVDPNRYTSHRILNEALQGDQIFQEWNFVFSKDKTLLI